MPSDAVHAMVASLPSVTGFGADTVQNVVHLGQDGILGPGELEAAAEAFVGFYTAVATGATAALGTYLGQSISRTANACTIQVYSSLDLSGATPFGSPVHTESFTMPAAAGGSPLPEEVALVCSINGDLTDVPVSAPNPTPPPATIRPASRRRGRLYLGPLNSSTLASASGVPRPVQNLQDDLADAMDELAVTINAIGTVYLGIWSKADEDVYPVVGGHVNNAWDVQRRRGNEPTARTTFTV